MSFAKKPNPSRRVTPNPFLPKPGRSLNDLTRSSENQLENIVENEVASLSVGKELECLAVVHRSLLFVDLRECCFSQGNLSHASAADCIITNLLEVRR